MRMNDALKCYDCDNFSASYDTCRKGYSPYNCDRELAEDEAMKRYIAKSLAMPRRVTNREKLSKMALYDMLTMMNRKLKEQPDNSTDMCIMCCLMISSDVGAICTDNCANCIASYLNKEAQ